MKASAIRDSNAKRWLAAALCFGLCLSPIGCSETVENKPSESAPTQDVKKEGPSERAPAPIDEGFVPFHQAVLLEPPANEQRPPDLTAGGKSSAKLFETIAGVNGVGGLWNQVRFKDAQGRTVKHFALVKTDAGDFTLELYHESAPNHVRSFVCLARAGYFDGLPFHCSSRREGTDGVLGYLESGSPTGANDLGHGGIGYWLKPEIQGNLKHEAGTVGAWHREEIDSAACRFYVTLNKNPALDGNYTIFGKVVKGLDVVHTINKRPIQDDAYQGPALEPYRIRQVLIQTGD